MLLAHKKKTVDYPALRTNLRAGGNPMLCAELAKRCGDACNRIDERALDLRMACYGQCQSAYDACLNQP